VASIPCTDIEVPFFSSFFAQRFLIIEGVIDGEGRKPPTEPPGKAMLDLLRKCVEVQSYNREYHSKALLQLLENDEGKLELARFLVKCESKNQDVVHIAAIMIRSRCSDFEPVVVTMMQGMETMVGKYPGVVLHAIAHAVADGIVKGDTIRLLEMFLPLLRKMFIHPVVYKILKIVAVHALKLPNISPIADILVLPFVESLDIDSRMRAVYAMRKLAEAHLYVHMDITLPTTIWRSFLVNAAIQSLSHRPLAPLLTEITRTMIVVQKLHSRTHQENELFETSMRLFQAASVEFCGSGICESKFDYDSDDGEPRNLACCLANCMDLCLNSMQGIRDFGCLTGLVQAAWASCRIDFRLRQIFHESPGIFVEMHQDETDLHSPRQVARDVIAAAFEADPNSLKNVDRFMISEQLDASLWLFGFEFWDDAALLQLIRRDYHFRELNVYSCAQLLNVLTKRWVGSMTRSLDFVDYVFERIQNVDPTIGIYAGCLLYRIANYEPLLLTAGRDWNRIAYVLISLIEAASDDTVYLVVNALYVVIQFWSPEISFIEALEGIDADDDPMLQASLGRISLKLSEKSAMTVL